MQQFRSMRKKFNPEMPSGRSESGSNSRKQPTNQGFIDKTSHVETSHGEQLSNNEIKVQAALDTLKSKLENTIQQLGDDNFDLHFRSVLVNHQKIEPGQRGESIRYNFMIEVCYVSQNTAKKRIENMINIELAHLKKLPIFTNNILNKIGRITFSLNVTNSCGESWQAHVARSR